MTEISAMYEALDNMDDYALMANVKPIGPHKVLTDAIAELEQLRQRVAELEKERDGLISKNQNLFNALMLSTQKKDSMYMTIKAASGHLNLYGLFSCIEGDSYDPECADKNVRKANSILKAELTTEVIKPAGKEDQAVYDSIARNYYK